MFDSGCEGGGWGQGVTLGLEQKVTQAFFSETISEITFWTLRALHVQHYTLGPAQPIWVSMTFKLLSGTTNLH